MDLQSFLTLPTDVVAGLVRAENRPVCVFPINGTRRWYLLEHVLGRTSPRPSYPDSEAGYMRDYLARTAQVQVRVARMFFAHGIHTLMISLFGTSLLERSRDYIAVGFDEGLARIGRASAFLDFYREMGVRVRFYGDYRRVFPQLGYSHLVELFDQVMENTRGHDQHLLCFGLSADDPVEAVAQLAVAFYTEHGRAPRKQELIALYYGECIPAVDLVIGFDKPCVFDVPLLDMGDADLYFMVSPSPYLSVEQFRRILYDHLYSRRMAEQDYTELGPETLRTMKSLYDLNRQATLGLGCRHEAGGFWYPVPQVRLPPELQAPSEPEV